MTGRLLKLRDFRKVKIAHFSGGDSSLEEMIATTDRGLLVTRFWYIRQVNP
jgi:predicted Zn-dependent protease